MSYQTGDGKKVNLKRFYFILALLFVYIVLFEFILPVNKVLPKPSILWETIPVLFSEYGILKALAVTTSAIYVSIIIGYLLVDWFAASLLWFKSLAPQFVSIAKVFKYIPAFFYAILFAFWFHDSILAEFLFIFIAVMFFMKLKVLQLSDSVKEEYVVSAKSFGLSDNDFYSKVVWKSVQPEFFKNLKQFHIYLWVLALVYEFIGGSNGVGSIFSAAVHFRDLAAAVILTIIVALLIWFGEFLIKYFEKRIVYWES